MLQRTALGREHRLQGVYQVSANDVAGRFVCAFATTFTERECDIRYPLSYEER